MAGQPYRYRIEWDRDRVGWVLTYDGQTLASVRAYLPGQSGIGDREVQAWADRLLGGPQAWTPICGGYQA